MVDRKLNERESLELIAQMIRNTRRNLDAGGGNMFLLWGYTGVVVTLGVWAALYFTNCTACLWGFWALPVVGWLLSWWFGRRWRKQQGAKDYTDRVVSQVWQMIGIACCGVAVFATLYQAYGLILPLCAMLVSLGSLLTGIIIRYTLFSGLPSLGFAWSLVLVFQVVAALLSQEHIRLPEVMAAQVNTSAFQLMFSLGKSISLRLVLVVKVVTAG